jgi:hypothetical protein
MHCSARVLEGGDGWDKYSGSLFQFIQALTPASNLSSAKEAPGRVQTPDQEDQRENNRFRMYGFSFSGMGGRCGWEVEELGWNDLDLRDWNHLAETFFRE